MKTGTIALGNASIHINYSQVIPPNQRGKARELTEFHVPEAHRGKGEGSALLQDVCDQADNEGLLLLITADTPRLAEYYQRFGFVIIQQENVIMLARSPKAATYGQSE